MVKWPIKMRLYKSGWEVKLQEFIDAGERLHVFTHFESTFLFALIIDVLMKTRP